MKRVTLALATSLLALTACDAPIAAENECDRHPNLTSEEHADCVAKLKTNETELRNAE